MIRVFILIGIIGLLCFVFVVMAFRVIDASLEIDGLKSQIKLQRESIKFLELIVNHSNQQCCMSVTTLENIARESGYHFFWEGETGLIGPFRVIRKNSCFEKIDRVGL